MLTKTATRRFNKQFETAQKQAVGKQQYREKMCYEINLIILILFASCTCISAVMQYNDSC